MKIAALYDIHGNLPALNAVFEEFKEVQPDLIIIGGDIVSGPMPVQTLDRLSLEGDKVRFIRGNGDREVVIAFDGQSLSHLTEKGRKSQQWVAKQLTHSHRDFLAQLPEHITLSVEGLGDILFCHATPRSDEEIFTPNTSMERLTAIFNNVDQQIVVCGHTHIQFKQQVGGVCVLNAGSVGMPFADHPGAYWLLLGPGEYEFRRTTYDREAAMKEINFSSDPQAPDVLKLIAEAEGMAMLESIEDKD